MEWRKVDRYHLSILSPPFPLPSLPRSSVPHYAQEMEVEVGKTLKVKKPYGCHLVSSPSRSGAARGAQVKGKETD